MTSIIPPHGAPLSLCNGTFESLNVICEAGGKLKPASEGLRL